MPFAAAGFSAGSRLVLALELEVDLTRRRPVAWRFSNRTYCARMCWKTLYHVWVLILGARVLKFI